MDKRDIAIRTLTGVCLLLAATLALTLLKGCVQREGAPVFPTSTERKTVTVYDTVYIDMPIARDSVAVRFVSRVLPLIKGASPEAGDSCRRDSAEVEIPITQKEYGDSTYRAWVSGYMANLDSIQIFRRTDYIRETNYVRERKRWGFTVGPAAGLGWNGHRIEPYIGIGISWGFCF